MDFTLPFLPGVISWLSIALALLTSLVIGVRVPWGKLFRGEKLNLWLTSTFVLSLIWMIRASLESGLNIHLSGAMLITLMFGWRLAVLGMSLVCVLVSVWGNSLPLNLGLAIIINADLSVTFCYALFLLIEAGLERHVFVYLFLSAFFGAALNYLLTGTVSVLALWFYGAFPWSELHDYLPFYYLMAFAEAFLTCGLITLFVCYRPQWVYSFRDERYLNR